MAKNDVLVFDIGSSKIRAIIANKGVNNTFIIRASTTIEYDGFYEGRFLDEEKIVQVFSQALENLDFKLQKHENKVYIGVPAEFSSVSLTSANISLGDRRKVRQSDIDSLFYSACEKAKEENAEILTICPIKYRLDEGRIVSDPIGEPASVISADLSIAYASRTFISLFNNIVGSLGFDKVEYISEPLAEAVMCIPAETREDVCMIINIGDLTSSVAFAKGEGLLQLYSFSYGGGHITNDLAERFDLSMSEADRLKRQIVLSLKGKQSDFYELTTDEGNVTKIPLNEANETVAYRIDTIGSTINQCLQLFSKERIQYLPIFLTGAGVSLIRSGRDYLAKCLGRNISFGTVDLPGKKKPQDSSILSLLGYALKDD